MRIATVGVLAAVVLAMTYSTARACSIGYPLPAWETLPADGATDVPLNAVLVAQLVYGAIGSHGTEVELRLETGEAVPTHIEASGTGYGSREVHAWRRIRPDELLLPETRYTLFTRLDAEASCTDCPWVPTASFETGIGQDTSAPIFAGLEPLGVESYDATAGDGGCFAGAGNIYSLGWSAAIDDGPVAYRVTFRDDDTVSAYLFAQTSTTVFDYCFGSDPIAAPFTSGGPVSVRAVDMAGNDDGNTIVRSFDAPCPERAAPDAGGEPMPDGGGPMPGAGGGGGCHVSSRGGSLTGWAVLLVAFLVARTTRRSS
jgi:hypothetical protein